MGKKVRFQPDKKSLDQFLHDLDASGTRQAAQTVKGRCGSGFTIGYGRGSQRSNAFILATSKQARDRQAREHVIERAIGGGI